MAPIIRALDPIVVEYLKSRIETGDSFQTKKALQEICKYYRDGFRISPGQLVAFEQCVVGALYTQGDNEKVRRWALNAIARLGREAQCLQAVEHTLKQYHSEPQTSAAAIAAIFRMSRKATQILKKLSFDEQMLTLAALQHVDANKLDMSAFPINVETASPDLLKLALVVVGLDRAPKNMMHPRYENAALVKALGAHHDNIVAQYTAWAITENPSLALKDLGIDLKLIEDQPANVRAWIYRLIAMSAEDAERNIEHIELGMRDPSSEARAGLASGLKSIYFDGLDALVLDWFFNEDDFEVRQHLLDHMIRQMHECPHYENVVVDLYQKEPRGSALRQRLEASASGMSAFSKLKRVNQADLFEGVSTVTNNTYNITGGVQGGAISLGGDASNSGKTSNHYSIQNIEHIQLELSKLEREIHESGFDDKLKAELFAVVNEAKSDPSPEKIWKVISRIRHAGELVLAGTAIWDIAQALCKLAGLG